MQHLKKRRANGTRAYVAKRLGAGLGVLLGLYVAWRVVVSRRTLSTKHPDSVRDQHVLGRGARRVALMQSLRGLEVRLANEIAMRFDQRSAEKRSLSKRAGPCSVQNMQACPGTIFGPSVGAIRQP